MKHCLVVLLLVFGIFVNACADSRAADALQAEYSADDSLCFEKVMILLDEEPSLPAPDMLVKTALSFLGTPYEAGLLENGPETLLIETSGTDCILFVEMCLALTHTFRSGDRTFGRFVGETARLRYREGVADSYASRLHYTSEWISKAEKRGILSEITERMGGKSLKQEFSFMSTHPESYRQLKEDSSLVGKIAAVERELSAKQYFYIPKAELPRRVSDIRTGDIVCFTSTVKGLDIAHIGIALEKDGILTFIHASSDAGKVIINETPLVEYTNGVRNQSGVRILRLTL